MLEEGKNYFADLIVETTQKKKQKLVRVHQIITNAQNILDKNGVTKEELESVIKDLKTLANAVVDSTEEIKLLNGLLNKLSALSTTPNEIPTPPASPNSDELKNTADDNDKLKEKAEASQPQVQKDQETIKNNLNDDIKQAQSGTDDDKVEVVKNAGKIHGEEGFEKQKTQIEAIKEELIQNNPVKYREGIIGEIEENMKKNNLSSEELDKELETE
ncbi:7584_t:CDS:2 [Ambispora leptoticha]|uniref:7584_t:CDS:1 n=1 Tax=Ambispora leptoticha TaxID=144679 RepID=A0A9N9C1V0_9GLOM|nr:7584_t:CDS:2 [Ambispora leptoticha]